LCITYLLVASLLQFPVHTGMIWGSRVTSLSWNFFDINRVSKVSDITDLQFGVTELGEMFGHRLNIIDYKVSKIYKLTYVGYLWLRHYFWFLLIDFVELGMVTSLSTFIIIQLTSIIYARKLLRVSQKLCIWLRTISKFTWSLEY
jgi:hypothetical protein